MFSTTKKFNFRINFLQYKFKINVFFWNSEWIYFEAENGKNEVKVCTYSLAIVFLLKFCC